MKTSQLISTFTTATTVLLHSFNMVKRIGLEEFKEVTGESSIHLHLSYPSDVVRDLFDDLPDNLKTEEIQLVRDNLYPHQFQDDYLKFNYNVSAIFKFSHALHSEMHEAKTKFGFADS